MNAQNPELDLDAALTVAVVELLLNPEYSFGWLKDIASDYSSTPLTEDQVDELDTTLTRTLDQLAIPFVESLPESVRGVYKEILEKRSAALHPLGNGHGQDIEL